MRFRNPKARALGALLLTAAALWTAGCNDNGPVDVVDTGGNVVGAWTGVSFGGNPVPISEYVQDPDKGTCFRELRGVDLSYSETGQYTWIEEVFLDCSSTSAPQTLTNTFTGTYRIDGIKLYMKDSASTAEQEYTFTVAANVLSMRVKFGSASIVSMFQRS